MPYYRPATPRQAALALLSRFETRLGRRARQALIAPYGRRAMADFETRLLLIKPGDLCLDLGANVGDFTRELATRGCDVHAYEPDPTAWERLVANVGALPNVTLHNCAVAATAGVFRLHRSREFAANPLEATVMSSIAFTDRERFQDDEAIDVEVRAFRDVVAGFGRRVALVKMDIEGAEFDILRQVFAKPADFDIDAIFCETHERHTRGEFREIDRMRRASASLARPYVNLYWP